MTHNTDPWILFIRDLLTITDLSPASDLSNIIRYLMNWQSCGVWQTCHFDMTVTEQKSCFIQNMKLSHELNGRTSYQSVVMEEFAHSLFFSFEFVPSWSMPAVKTTMCKKYKTTLNNKDVVYDGVALYLYILTQSPMCFFKKKIRASFSQVYGHRPTSDSCLMSSP